MKTYLSFIFLIVFQSCELDRIQNSSGDKLLINHLNEDTLQSIKKAREFDHKSKLQLLSTEKDNNLSLNIDTLELQNMVYACDCPDWFDSSGFVQAKGMNEAFDSINWKIKNTYYIEPADTSLSFAKIEFLPLTKVKLIGRKYLKPRLPNYSSFQDPNPPKGNVFKYYSYQIIRPYQIYFTIYPRVPNTLDVQDSLIYLTIK